MDDVGVNSNSLIGHSNVTLARKYPRVVGISSIQIDSKWIQQASTRLNGFGAHGCHSQIWKLIMNISVRCFILWTSKSWDVRYLFKAIPSHSYPFSSSIFVIHEFIPSESVSQFSWAAPSISCRARWRTKSWNRRPPGTKCPWRGATVGWCDEAKVSWARSFLPCLLYIYIYYVFNGVLICFNGV